MENQYEILKLESQLCFPLYAVSKEIIRKYKPLLDKINLTYTQYITMMVLWEHNEINVKELGEKLFLDSGTLTPLLKNLEGKNYIKRSRSSTDERMVYIKLTDEGEDLKKLASSIPAKILKSFQLSVNEVKNLYEILYKTLDNLSKN